MDETGDRNTVIDNGRDIGVIKYILWVLAGLAVTSMDYWRKQGMTAFKKITIGEVLANPNSGELYEKCLRETIAVAKATSVKVADNAFEAAMTVSKNTAQNSKSSLLADIENGRRNEVETLNGAVVRLARKNNISVPVNKMIYRAIKS